MIVRASGTVTVATLVRGTGAHNTLPSNLTSLVQLSVYLGTLADGLDSSPLGHGP